jgi:hypothetical protein
VLGVLFHAPMGPFYSPKAARSHWSSICKAIVAFSVGAPYSPVHHRTMNSARFPSFSSEVVRCSHDPRGTLDILVWPSDCWWSPRVARWSRGWPLAWARLTHRTVRCTPDSPLSLSRGALSFSRERPVRRARQPEHRTLSGAPQVGASFARHSQISIIQSLLIWQGS